MTIGGDGVPSPKAYIISVNPARYAQTSARLSAVGLHPVHVQPLSPDSCAVVLDGRFAERHDFDFLRKTHSNKLTQMAIWRHIANDPDLGHWPPKDALPPPQTTTDVEGSASSSSSKTTTRAKAASGGRTNGTAAAATTTTLPAPTPLPSTPPPYSLVFEDDIALSDGIEPSSVVAITDTAASLATDAGVFYLGMCAPKCKPGSHVNVGGVEYARCVGRCAHAYGVFKHRAAFLYEELAAAAPGYLYDGSQYFYGDVFLHHGSEHMPNSEWPVLAGVQNTKEGIAVPLHQGIFIQDRVNNPSEIQLNTGA
jgi:hypothetical protein